MRYHWIVYGPISLAYIGAALLWSLPGWWSFVGVPFWSAACVFAKLNRSQPLTRLNLDSVNRNFRR